jgi:hypothetical protein
LIRQQLWNNGRLRMQPIKVEKFYTEKDKEMEALRLKKLYDQHERNKFQFANAPRLMELFVRPTDKNLTNYNQAIQKSYMPDKEGNKFLRVIQKQAVKFSNQYMERSLKKAELAKFDQSLLKPKEKFLFGEKGDLLFSDNENKSSGSRSKHHDPIMLEKNFTRKPYA